jgi:hypothetical protein
VTSLPHLIDDASASLSVAPDRAAALARRLNLDHQAMRRCDAEVHVPRPTGRPWRCKPLRTAGTPTSFPAANIVPPPAPPSAALHALIGRLDEIAGRPNA